MQDRYRDTMALHLRTGTIRMAEPFVSASHAGTEARAMLVNQLRAYRFELIARKAHGVEQPPKKMWGGKTSAMSDDLAIAAQMAAFWPSVHAAEGERCLVSCI